MEYINQWLNNNYVESKDFTDLQRQLMINSIPNVQGSMESSYIDEEFTSTGEDEEVFFQSYDNYGAASAKKSGTIPLNDSSAIVNVELPTNKLGGLKNTAQQMRCNPAVNEGASFDLEGNGIVDRFNDLNLHEDKENGGGVGDEKSSTYYQTAKLLNRKAVDDKEDVDYQADVSLCINEPSAEVKDATQESDDDYELILDEYPIAKKNRCVSNGSLTITPDLLNKSDGSINYFGELPLMEDQSYLPRYFQHHRLTKSSSKNLNEPYEYFKNKNCPPSASTGVLLNYCHHRYSRILKIHSPPFKESQFEVLCRFCRGKNWVSKPDYIDHLTFSHGIITIDYLTPPIFLPIPKSMFILQDRSFRTFHVSCPTCSKWIRLGNSVYDDGSNVQPKTQGLYYWYFHHYMESHEEDFNCNYCHGY